jgi:ATP-dependent exoDNAse (exonuclease V) beta subunit
LGEEAMRIYYVAVSRAREKVVLLHSILPEAIPLMNEQSLLPHAARFFR